MHRAITSLLLAYLLTGLSAATGGAGDRVVNGDFEAGEAGKAPEGWFVPTAGYRAEVTEETPGQGKRSARIAPAGGERAAFGNLMQSIDAAAYRGKKVRLRAAVRVEGGESGRAQLWLREDRTSEQRGFFDNMGDRPIRGGDWGYYTIEGSIRDDAASLNFGLMVLGGATAWLDDVTLEVLGAAEVTATPAREISARGVENVVAFARLTGYVRFFHASDVAVELDWDRFVYEGAKAVEGAANAEELVGKLRELFGPIAPAVVIQLTNGGAAEAAVPLVKGDRAARWVHHGLGPRERGAQSVYASWVERVTLDEDGKLPEGWPDASAPFSADLGGGAACRVPLVAKGEQKGPETAASRVSAGKPDYSGEDRATRIAAVVQLWTPLQHFYPYFDATGTDWDGALVEGLRRAAVDKGEREFLKTLRWMVAQLRDGHGGVYHNFDDAIAVPPLALDWVEGQLVVTAAEGAAAEGEHAIGRGTVIETIDGRAARAVLRDCEALISAATGQWARSRAVREVLAGHEGTSVKLGVTLADGTKAERSMVRSANRISVREARPPAVEEIKPGVWYVDIDRLADGMLKDRWKELASAKGVIFDLRGYPSSGEAWTILGHLTDERMTCAQWLIPNVKRPDHKDMEFARSNWPVLPLKPRVKGKVAFLTGGGAISAAETLMGIVEHYKLGEIFGGPTAGTNGNVNTLQLPGGYNVAFTGMKVLKHDGAQHHGVGIQPTRPVTRTIAGVRAGRDEVLEAAVEWAGQE